MPKKIAGLDLYTLQEISETLGVTTSTLRNYIKKKKIKARKLAGSWHVTDKALKEYFDGNDRTVRKKKKTSPTRTKKETK